MPEDFLDAAFFLSATPKDEEYELYAAKIRKCMMSMNICLEWRTFMTFFWLSAFTLELTEDSDILADTIHRSLCIEEERAAALGAKISKNRGEIKTREGCPLSQKERTLLEKYRNSKSVESQKTNELSSNTCPQTIDSIAASLVEISLSSIVTLSSYHQSHAGYNTLWILPHVMTPGLKDSLSMELSVFAEGIFLSEFRLGESSGTIRGFVAHFPTVHAACLCAYSICQRNFLVGTTLRSSSVYVYAETSMHNLRTISEYVETTPAMSDVESSSTYEESNNPIDEPAIKKLQNPIILNKTNVTMTTASISTGNSSEPTSHQSQDSESDDVPHFTNPNYVVKLTNIPNAYRGIGFRKLKILKGKTPPKCVLHGYDDGGSYVMYIEFEYATPLQKFMDACKSIHDETIKIRATRGKVPSNYSSLESLEPRDVWYNRTVTLAEEKKDTGVDSPIQGPVVEVIKLPEIYRNLTQSEEFWCGENRPLLWWSLLSKVTQDTKNKGTFYFYFKYRAGEEVKSVKWFKKSLFKALSEKDVQGVSINILNKVPAKAGCHNVEIPASRQ